MPRWGPRRGGSGGECPNPFKEKDLEKNKFQDSQEEQVRAARSRIGRCRLGGIEVTVWRKDAFATFDPRAFFRIYLVRFAARTPKGKQTLLLYFRQLAVPKLVKPARSQPPDATALLCEIPGWEKTSRKFWKNGEIVKSGI
jgi:hypothetical protein